MAQERLDEQVRTAINSAGGVLCSWHGISDSEFLSSYFGLAVPQASIAGIISRRPLHVANVHVDGWVQVEYFDAQYLPKMQDILGNVAVKCGVRVVFEKAKNGWVPFTVRTSKEFSKWDAMNMASPRAYID